MTGRAAASPVADEVVRAALRGRREAALLDVPSVARAAGLLAERCRDPSWVRTAVTSLDRFRSAVVGEADGLEPLLAGARRDPRTAEQALERFAASLRRHAPLQVETLAFGAKTWLRLGGVPLLCRPLGGSPAPPPGLVRGSGGAARAALPVGVEEADLRLVLLSLVGSGLTAAELLGVRLSDAGALDEHGAVVPDPLASPLALGFVPDGEAAGDPGGEGDGRRRLAFLPAQARAELTAALARRVGAGEELAADAPLFAPAGAGPALLAAARHHHERLIEAGNDVNVTTCRMTGDFFRAWGMPGARFRPVSPAGPPPEDDHQ